jgi:hypothetical protein
MTLEEKYGALLEFIKRVHGVGVSIRNGTSEARNDIELLNVYKAMDFDVRVLLQKIGEE